MDSHSQIIMEKKTKQHFRLPFNSVIVFIIRSRAAQKTNYKRREKSKVNGTGKEEEENVEEKKKKQQSNWKQLPTCKSNAQSNHLRERAHLDSKPSLLCWKMMMRQHCVSFPAHFNDRMNFLMRRRSVCLRFIFYERVSVLVFRIETRSPSLSALLSQTAKRTFSIDWIASMMRDFGLTNSFFVSFYGVRVRSVWMCVECLFLRNWPFHRLESEENDGKQHFKRRQPYFHNLQNRSLTSSFSSSNFFVVELFFHRRQRFVGLAVFRYFFSFCFQSILFLSLCKLSRLVSRPR